MKDNSRPVVLTIAGLDPSGGAGIVADIKTIAALGCFPAAAITSITYQNTTGVFGAENQTAATLRSQIDPIVQDLEVAAVKTGMLPTAEIVAEVARTFLEGLLPAPIVDPVMVSTSGHDLIGDEAFQILKGQLLRVARVVTPNIPEAERLAGFSIETEDQMRKAARIIKGFGAAAVLIKGGHRKLKRQGTAEALDLLLTEDGEFLEFSDEYIEVGEVHGSGCTLSAAIAAELAKGMTLEAAVRSAKAYVSGRIRALLTSRRIGKGALPM
jgi:hydroxymethylpyrimidine kinase/phosphomethylpyrimidine kinase